MRQISADKKTAIDNQDFELAINLKELERIYSEELAEEDLALKNIKNLTKVTDCEVKAILSEITGVNLDTALQKESVKLYDRLASRIIGQDNAVRCLSEAVMRSYAGINSPDKPRGIFLFLGESGVGKTELAKALSSELFYSQDSLIRYDMSEFSESYSISKFIGSAPGYVGYDEQNSPLEKIRKHPYSVILFDEIEKAHPDVLSLFLQIFDNGYLTDATGRKISFRNTYIIMTSNIGKDNLSTDKFVGFLNTHDKDSIQEKLRGIFKDEFINRIDEIILFSHLNVSELKEIARKRLSDLSVRMLDLGIKLRIDECVYEYIATKSEEKGFGARPINRFIISNFLNKKVRLTSLLYKIIY